jgi:hypothetical protein
MRDRPLIRLLIEEKWRSWEMVEGIQFVTNSAGKKVAVLIDLEKYGELWEDFYDAIITRQRASEPRESLESVREALKQQGKLNA